MESLLAGDAALANSRISFKPIQENQPYTAYTEQEVEAFKMVLKKTGKADVKGARVF